MNEFDRLNRLRDIIVLGDPEVDQALGRYARDMASLEANLTSGFDTALSPQLQRIPDGSLADPYRDPAVARTLEATSGRTSASALLERMEAEGQRWLIESRAADLGWRDIAGLHERLMGSEPGLVQRLLDDAWRAAELASGSRLAEGLEAFRSPVEGLAAGILQSDTALWHDLFYLEKFNEASAVARLLGDPLHLERESVAAALAFSAGTAAFRSLDSCRQLLDAAGLVLPRWPRRRLLTLSEKRRRLRTRLQQAREPGHVRRAKTLVHKYETVLRSVIDEAMTATYGEDWADERLPRCGCNDLLGKWRNGGGGFVLEYADYHHYRRIMTHDEHFADVFSAAFPDLDELGETLQRAGALRAASHHARSSFAPGDLVELRVVWRLLEGAMAVLMADSVAEEW